MRGDPDGERIDLRVGIPRIDQLIRMQEHLDRLDRSGIEEMQLRKLNALLKKEKQRGAFYRALPDHLERLSELSALPFTTDEDLAQNAGGLLLCSQAEIQRILSDATSGTTGAAKRVFYTEGDCRHTVELFMAGLGELVFPGSATMICFPFSGPFGLGELIAEAIEGLGARPLKLGAGLSYGEYRRAMAEEQPDTFVGMPVQLLSILRTCGKGSLKRALVSGDSCPGSVIRGCEDLLGSRLFPHYGSREMALGGAICCPAHSGMHLRENHVIAEIVDPQGNVLPDGETGELVITTIGMEAMPLVRYRTGDRTRLIRGQCECGSWVTRLDTVRREEAEEMLQLDELLFQNPNIIDYRAERSGNSLRLTILTTGGNALQLPIDAEICRRPVHDSDRSLYAGKRKILREDR